MSFYPCLLLSQDNPVVDDLKITYDLDFSSCLAGPRWNDGYQHFEGVMYEVKLERKSLSLLPSKGGSAHCAGNSTAWELNLRVLRCIQ